MAGFSEIGTGGFGPNSSFRFSGFRFGNLDGRSNTFRYPSPWWDVAHMELPTTVKHLFRWCRYHMLVNPLVSSVTQKMSAYPLTTIVIDEEDREGFDKNKKRWEDLLFRVLNMTRFQIEAGLDYNGYGNCLRGDTKVVTRESGPVPIVGLQGKKVEVLSAGGKWREAAFFSFGKQEIFEIELGTGEKLYATAEHEWPVASGRNRGSAPRQVKMKTKEIVGRYLIREVAPRPERDHDFLTGVQHGICYGDGTTAAPGKNTGHLLLFTAEKRALAALFTGYTVTPHHQDRYLGVYGLPREWKSLPGSEASASYWYGFVCGLIATDGSVSKRGEIVLTQKDREVLDIIHEKLPWLGMMSGQVQEYESRGFNGPSTMHRLYLRPGYMEVADFVRRDQAERFESCGNKKSGSRWSRVKVASVVSVGCEEVFCGYEPETHTFVIENGILTGNCLVSIIFPFHKYLVCSSCGYKERIKRLKFRKDWDFRNFEYLLTCPKCGTHAKSEARDEFYKSYRDIKLIRWNPQDIEIDFNPITQSTDYAYSIPTTVRQKVLQKNVRYLQELPAKFIEAMKSRRPVILTRENVFHFKAPTPSLAANDAGWGYPPILPALKDSFYLQVMKKGQEAVMLEHLVPLDIIYPASADQTSNPYLTVNLSDWKQRIELELVKWRWDPNYKPILPLPVGFQRIGGDGKALMLTQEIRAWSEHIIVGMGVPQEFAFGGLSWSGSSVSLRMLENMFMTYRGMHEHFLKHFIVPNIARFMGWEEVSLHMKSFKMADDIQAKQILLSLNQLRKISDQTLLSEFDKDALEELKIIEQELRRNLEIAKLDSLYKAQIQGESQKVMTKYQIESQEQMQEAQAKFQSKMQGAQPEAGVQPQEPMAPPQENQVNVLDLADAWAKKLSKLAPEESTSVLAQMSQQNPKMHEIVQQKMSVLKALGQRPLPEQRPPRRTNAAI